MRKVSSADDLASQLKAFKLKHHTEQHEKDVKPKYPQPSFMLDRLSIEMEREAKRKAAEAAEEDDLLSAAGISSFT